MHDGSSCEDGSEEPLAGSQMSFGQEEASVGSQMSDGQEETAAGSQMSCVASLEDRHAPDERLDHRTHRDMGPSRNPPPRASLTKAKAVAAVHESLQRWWPDLTQALASSDCSHIVTRGGPLGIPYCVRWHRVLEDTVCESVESGQLLGEMLVIWPTTELMRLKKAGTCMDKVRQAQHEASNYQGGVPLGLILVGNRVLGLQDCADEIQLEFAIT
ncbi:MAG: hypothetical protein SGPRY_011155, partial [Prymnesium sp.]